MPLIPDVENNSGEEVHSVSEPLPAYLLPQDPYFSVTKKYLQPPLGILLGPSLAMHATSVHLRGLFILFAQRHLHDAVSNHARQC